jgi:hypothetical protein
VKKAYVRVKLDFVVALGIADGAEHRGIPPVFPDLPGHLMDFIEAGWRALPKAPDADILPGTKLSLGAAKPPLQDAPKPSAAARRAFEKRADAALDVVMKRGRGVAEAMQKGHRRA